MIGFILAAFVFLIEWPLGLFLAKRRGEKLKSKERLPDVIHEFLPDLRKLKPINDVGAYLLVGSAILYDTSFISLNKFGMCISAIHGIRPFFFLSTTLPDASQIAHLKSGMSRYFVGGIHDLVFSGHISNIYVSIMYLWHMGALTTIMWWILVSFNILCAIIAVGSRSHYTVDVLVAFPVCHWILDRLLF